MRYSGHYAERIYVAKKSGTSLGELSLISFFLVNPLSVAQVRGTSLVLCVVGSNPTPG